MGDAGARPAGALPLQQTAALVGTYRWAEERLFSISGRWAAEPSMTPRAQVHLFEASSRHGWHAELWADRLPVLAGTDARALTRPAGPWVEPLLDALAGTEGVVPRLAGLHRVVLPRLAATYRRHLARTSPVADRPVERVLRLVLADLDEVQVAGAAVLGGIEDDVEHAGRSAGTPGLDRLAAVFVHGGGAGAPMTGAADGDEGCLLPWPAA